MKNIKNLTVLTTVALGYFVSVKSVLAGGWDAGTMTTSVSVGSTLGEIDTLDSILLFVANLLKYVGWAGVIIAILAVIGLLIFKLIGEDSENTMKTVQGGITKAVVIALLGLMLLSAGWFVSFISTFIGADTVPTMYDGEQGSYGE